MMPQPPQSTYPRRQDSASIEQTVIMERQTQISRGRIIGGLPSMIGSRLMSLPSWAVITLLMCSWMGQGLALEQKYCSSQNTAKFEGGYKQYQSLGACHDQCLAEGFSLAVVQFHDCWCTDYIPHNSYNRDDCNVGCPGYDKEQCGNPDTGSFGYVELHRKKPKGTAPADDKPNSSTQTTTETPTSTETTPNVSIVTVTDGVKTITYTATDGFSAPSETSPVPSQGASSGGFFSNAGRVAGVFTVLAFVIIGGLLFLFFYLRRRKQQGSAPLSADSPTPPAMAGAISSVNEKRRSRSLSTLGLVGGGSSDKQVPTITTTPGSMNKSSGSAMKGGLTSSSITPPDRVTDQRLDPGQVWMRFENDHASRMSVRSLRDDQDYSRRVLRLANPDED